MVCEVISDPLVHEGGGNFDISNALEVVFTWLEFSYSVGLNHCKWEEFDEKWIRVPSLTASGNFQHGHPNLPKPQIQLLLNLYEQAVKLNNKRAKKIISIKENLKLGLDLKYSVTSNYSFLSFYKVIELISDDLASKKYVGTDNTTAKDMVKYQLMGSQRMKIYYLLNTIPNKFSLDEMIELADIRNDIAHKDIKILSTSLIHCQELAFWASEKFLEIINEK